MYSAGEYRWGHYGPIHVHGSKIQSLIGLNNETCSKLIEIAVKVINVRLITCIFLSKIIITEILSC